MAKYLMFIFCLTISVNFTFAQNRYYSPAQKKALARRAAIIDGYRQMAEAVQGVKISSKTTVKDFVTESDELKAEMETFILRGAQAVATRYMPDGTCEVDMIVNIGDLVSFLTMAQSQKNLSRWQNINFKQLYQLNNRVIKATGTGAPPGDLSKQQVQGLRTENANMKAQIAQLLATLSKLKSQLGQAQSSQQNIAITLQQNTALKKQIRNLQNENIRLRESLTQANRAFSGMNTYKRKYEELLIGYRKLQQRIHEFQTLLGNYQGYERKYKNAQGDIGKLKGELASLQQTFANYRGYQQRCQQLQQQTQQQQTLIKQMRGKLNNLQRTFANYSEYKTKYEEFVQKYNQLAAENAALRNKLGKMSGVKAQLGKLFIQIGDLRRKNRQLQSQSANQALLQQQLAKLQKNNHSLKNKKQRLATQVKSQQALIVRLQNDIAQLQSSVHTLKRRPQGAWVNITPRQKLLARRAAILDGYRQLLESLKGVKIDSKTSVKDFVTENDQIAAAAAGFVRGAQSTATRYLADGTCEVDMRVNVADFIKFLKKTARRHGRKRWRPKRFNKIYRHEQRRFIKVTGTGTFRSQ